MCSFNRMGPQFTQYSTRSGEGNVSWAFDRFKGRRRVACISDLSPCDFFVWGYLKKKVFQGRPSSLEKLNERIWQGIDAIPPQLTWRVMVSF
ncbi:hypothetical protein Trydic_g7971 [Trypoxylus dichotomus]